MSSAVVGKIIDGRERRVRFQSKNQRFAAIRRTGTAALGSRHESVHLLPGQSAFHDGVGMEPGRGSLVRAELVRLSQLEKRRGYRERVHDVLWPLCQSLAEVVFHGRRICKALAAVYASEPTYATSFALASVLARETGEALEGNGLEELVSGLVNALGKTKDADVSHSAYSALSYVFRYCARPLLEGVDRTGWPAARRWYSGLLCCESAHGRLLGARVLASLLRRMSRTALAKHALRLVATIDRVEGKRERLEASAAQLLFEVCRGVGGRLHSRARPVLDVLLRPTKRKRRGAATDRLAASVERMLLEDGRPGEELDVLWHAIVIAVRDCISATSADDVSTARAVERLAAAVEWRSGRLLSRRHEGDTAMPAEVASGRIENLCECLRALCEQCYDFDGGGETGRATVRLARAAARVAENSAIARTALSGSVEIWLVKLAGQARSNRVLAAEALAELGARDAAYQIALALARDDEPGLALLVAAQCVGAGNAIANDDEAALVNVVETALRSDEDRPMMLAAIAASPALSKAPVNLLRDAAAHGAHDPVVCAAIIGALSASGFRDEAVELALKSLEDITNGAQAPTLQAAADVLEANDVMDEGLVDALIVSAGLDTYPRRATLTLRLASRLVSPEDSLKVVLDTIRQINDLPVALESERQYAMLLNRLEVLSRRSDLPKRTVDAIVIGCLGLLFVKFEPLWALSKKLLEELADAHPDSLWPRLLAVLTRVSQPPAPSSAKTVIENAVASKHGNVCQRLRRAADRADVSSDGIPFATFLASRDEDNNTEEKRTVDADRAHEILWDTAKRCGIVAGRAPQAARVATDLFLVFMKRDFARAFDDDPDATEILELLDKEFDDEVLTCRPMLARRSAYKWLETLLAVFAEASAPRSLPRCDILRRVYERLLGKPRGNVAKFALACLRQYKFPFLTPYATRLEAMLDDKMLRDTLVKMRIGTSSSFRDVAGEEDQKTEKWTVDDSHCSGFAPLLCRLLFGRFRAKSSAVGGRRRGAPKARRATILSFVSGLEPQYLDFFVYIMVRPFLQQKLQPAGATIEQKMARLCAAADAENAVVAVKSSRIAGLLQLVIAIAPRFGFKAKKHAQLFLSLALAIIRCCQGLQADKSSRVDLQDDKPTMDEHDEDDYDDETESSARQAKRVRTLALKCVGDLLQQYATVDAIWELDGGLSTRLWNAVTPYLRPLLSGEQISTGQREPAMLELIARIAMTDSLKCLLTDESVHACCLRAACHSKLAMEVLCSLVLGDDEDTRDTSARQLLKPHSRIVIAALTAELDSRKKRHFPCSKLERSALDALCRIANLATLDEWPLVSEDASALASALAHRLLIVVDTSSDMNPTRFRNSVLTCLKAILPKVGYALCHVNEFAVLMAPPRQRKLATWFYAAADSIDARCAVADACVHLLRNHDHLHKYTSLGRAADLITALAGLRDDNQTSSAGHAMANSLEPDYERESAALSNLAHASTWSENLFDAGIKDLAAAPLVALCASTMRSGEPSLRDAASRALRAFIVAAFDSGTPSYVLEHTLLPHILRSLELPDDATRRAHVTVLSAIVTAARNANADEFFADLRILQSPNNPEVDFFENVAHIQSHRRSRALRRAASASAELNPLTIRRVIIPLALQPLRDPHCTDSLRGDAASCLGASVARLPWSHYSTLFKRICAWLKAQQEALSLKLSTHAKDVDSRRKLKGGMFEEKVSKSLEAASVTAICAMLDAFPFDISCTPGNDKDANKVLKGVMTWLLPNAQSLLNKPARNQKTGAREYILRSPLAMSLTRFTSKLPATHRMQESKALVVAVCAELRNRDATLRDVGRATLAKMVRYYAANVIGEVRFVHIALSELESALQSGYMLAVRSAALHSIISAMSKASALPSHSNEQQKNAVPVPDPRASVDAGIPQFARLLVNDLLGQAATARETHELGDHKAGSAAGVPESKKIVTRTYESFELLARATRCVNMDASALLHELLDPLLGALKDRATEVDDRQATEAARCRTALTRVATGIAANESASSNDILQLCVSFMADALGEELKFPTDSTVETYDVEENDEGEDEDSQLPIFDIDGDPKDVNSCSTKIGAGTRNVSGKVVRWLPSHEGKSHDGIDAWQRKVDNERENVRVLDGVQAPKLTGRRHRANEARLQKDADLALCFDKISFAILVLRQALKKRRDVFDINAMRNSEDPSHQAAKPLPALLAKVYEKHALGNDELQLGIVHIAATLLSWRLETARRWAGRMAKIALATLARSAKSGMLLGSDTVQASFKMLATLISYHTGPGRGGEYCEDNEEEDEEISGFYAIKLADRQLKAIASSVHVALASTRNRGSFDSHHAATYALLRALVRRPVLVSEIYDCMNTLAELRVTSLDRGERRHASSIFLEFLINYRMGKKRRKHYMAHLLNGLDYEYEEGRLAAVESLSIALKVLPVSLIDEHAEAFFAALALRTANEDVRDCLTKVTDSLITFLRRIPDATFRVYIDRTCTWLAEATANSSFATPNVADDGDALIKLRRLRLLSVRCAEAICRANAQYLAARADLVQSIVDKLAALLRESRDDAPAHVASIAATSNILTALPIAGERALAKLADHVRLLPIVVDALSAQTAQIRWEASRFVGNYLSRRSTVALRFDPAAPYEYLVDDEGALTKIAKVSLSHIDVNDDHFDQKLAHQSAKNLLFVAAVLHTSSSDAAVAWMFQRLSSMSCRRRLPVSRTCVHA